jgi:hypothetical protein
VNLRQALEQIYADVPAIDCQGLCHESCGPIIVDKPERDSIQRRHGVEVGRLAWDCPALTLLKRCGVYEDRPLICRLWGVVESMPCEWGCRPERYLTDAEGFALLARVREVPQ